VLPPLKLPSRHTIRLIFHQSDNPNIAEKLTPSLESLLFKTVNNTSFFSLPFDLTDGGNEYQSAIPLVKTTKEVNVKMIILNLNSCDKKIRKLLLKGLLVVMRLV
jgi:hypothetical protein